MFDGRTGAKAEWADLVSAASRAYAVFIGETHNHPLGLAAIAGQRGDTAEALAYLDRADQSFALAGEETYRTQVLAKRATLQSTAGNQTAQPRAKADPRIGPGLSRALQQDPASGAGE